MTTTTFSGVRLNGNFLNFPLAHNAKVKANWSLEGGSWFTYLPHNDRIEISLPQDSPIELRRCPTGLDMNVLFLLIGAVQKSKSSSISFPSFADLARRTGLNPETKSRDRLKDCLRYWAELSLNYTCWHEENKHGHVDKAFPPPIISVVISDGTQIDIQVAKDWVKLAQQKGYWKLAALPFSNEAVTQNRCLLTLTGLYTQKTEDGANISCPRNRRNFLRKIGLHHNRYNTVFKNVEARSAAWFAAHKGMLSTVRDDDDPNGLVAKGLIVFEVKLPKAKLEPSGCRVYSRQGAQYTKPSGCRVYPLMKEGSNLTSSRNETARAVRRSLRDRRLGSSTALTKPEESFSLLQSPPKNPLCCWSELPKDSDAICDEFADQGFGLSCANESDQYA